MTWCHGSIPPHNVSILLTIPPLKTGLKWSGYWFCCYLVGCGALHSKYDTWKSAVISRWMIWYIKEWIQTWKTSIFSVYQYLKHFTNLECKYQMTMQFIFTLSYSFLETYIILQELKLRKTIQAYFQNYGYEQEQQYNTDLSFYIAYDKIL